MSSAKPGNGLRLEVVGEESASGETARIYGAIRDYFGLGFVPDVFQLLGTRPQFLRGLWDMYLAMFENGVVPREVKELIAVVVARDASCAYCEGAHSFLAELLGVSPDVITKLRAGVDIVPVDGRLNALFGFVSQVNRSSSAITDLDVDRLRDIGWSDAEITEAIWTACVFNAVVRLVDSFGLVHVGQLRSDASAIPTQPAKKSP